MVQRFSRLLQNWIRRPEPHTVNRTQTPINGIHAAVLLNPIDAMHTKRLAVWIASMRFSGTAAWAFDTQIPTLP